MNAVILTHEQADFDAIASALGAALMNPEALPVAPRRANRNVRAFLTLYGADLPFLDARDLPHTPILSVILVDTQSMITLKGMNRRTAVQVVDHHALRGALPADWNVNIDPVGACTTLFVEGIAEQDVALTPIHATLLLLGIYEDTGSLSYTLTTPRDVRAAAYLLEHGANLQLLSRYLNPPLSAEQLQVYDQLVASALRVPIQGCNLLICTAQALELRDEISAIAHKLRDLLDPDAVILLVQTHEGIRMVARATTDQVNVARVAERFGGGGHGRAAAALIHQAARPNMLGQEENHPTLAETCDELLTLLPGLVQPPLTVQQVMSPNPLALAPDTPAERAQQLMLRYGYEGFPVVEDGRVVGLLTRRAVDRALAHKLNLPASSLMEAGEVTVHPQDSIEQVRQTMMDSGWGQIPVMDAENGQLVGIITRTDLIKTAGESAAIPGKQNLSTRLEAALPASRLALLKVVSEEAFALKMAVYIVGGVVRDLILARPSSDFDIVVEGDAIALANTLAARFGGRVVSHSHFGTAKWTLNALSSDFIQRLSLLPSHADLPDSLDLISARTEFYDYPTALPSVERSSIKLDLHRRDFTINTLALRLDGASYGDLYDYWGGLRDLRRGLVRVLHSLSFVDDPTRLIRAVRFEQRFGFEIEARTLHLMAEARPLVKQVSGDRLRHELNLILQEGQPQRALARLDALGLLEAIHPGLGWSAQLDGLLEQILHGTPEPNWGLPERIANLPCRLALAYLLWLTNYPAEEAEAIANRLRLPSDLHELICAVHQLQRDLPALPGQPPSEITFRLDETPLAALFMVHLPETDAARREVIENYLHLWRQMVPHTNGDTLLALHLPRGPHYRKILISLRAGWLNGTITSENDEKAHLLALIQALPASLRGSLME